MPNWCYNVLTIIGKESELKKFANTAKTETSHLSFGNFIPYPEKYAELDKIAHEWEIAHPDNPWEDRPKDGYNQGGYEWCIENWGTKWDADCGGDCDDILGLDGVIQGKSITYHFDTAWCPPEPVVKKMGEMFPQLRFELYYEEEGEGFKGEIVISKGKVLYESCVDYYEDDFDEDYYDATCVIIKQAMKGGEIDG